MDPATAAALAEFGGSAIGSLLGGNGDASRRRALEYLMSINPEMGKSALENMAYDPALVKSQMGAIDELRRVYDEGGLDTQSRAALEQAQASTAAAERGQRGAITQNFAARGAGGAGTELAAQLTSQQSGANRNRMAGVEAAGDARSRAINALLSSTGAAANLRGQEFQKAGGLDAVSKFNAAQRLRKGEAAAGLYGDIANAGDRAGQRAGNVGGGLGAAVGGLSSLLTRKNKDPEEDEQPQLLNQY